MGHPRLPLILRGSPQRGEHLRMTTEFLREKTIKEDVNGTAQPGNDG
jgi:hypothetical protein